jgi:hypothetical protein
MNQVDKLAGTQGPGAGAVGARAGDQVAGRTRGAPRGAQGRQTPALRVPGQGSIQFLVWKPYVRPLPIPRLKGPHSHDIIFFLWFLSSINSIWV